MPCAVLLALGFALWTPVALGEAPPANPAGNAHPAAGIESSGAETRQAQVLEPPETITYPAGDELRLKTFPNTVFYPRYLADPRQMMMKGLVLHVLKTEIEQTDSPLLEFTLGGWVRLLRIHPARHPELGLQLSAGAAFIGRFDLNANYDAIGWDGYYSFRIEFKPIRELTFKLADQHDSGHVADEYIRKTGRKRLTYTREEVALGVVYSPDELGTPFRVYGEAGYGVHLGNKNLRRWRTQCGAEVEFQMVYVAFDSTFWQEMAFSPSMTAQLGLQSQRPTLGRRFGLALQFENGRTLLGEFYKAQNRTLGVGFWADL